MSAPSCLFPTILVIDFGSQYSHLIVRRLRSSNVYAELISCTVPLSSLSFQPKGVILSGGPASVYEEEAPHVDKSVFDWHVPVLGICYGLQEMTRCFGGTVSPCQHREFGLAPLTILNRNELLPFPSLFGSELLQAQVWMSHGDQVTSLASDFVVTATTAMAPIAAIQHQTKPFYGVQFHPEVTHTPLGAEWLSHFAHSICQIGHEYTMTSFLDHAITTIQTKVGPTAHVLGALSGGVDSSVAACLMTRAIGHRFHGVCVDNGLLRQDEANQVKQMLDKGLGVEVTVVDATETFLNALTEVREPEKKRKIIGNTFIHVFAKEAERLKREKQFEISFLLQGTLYPDVIESLSYRGPSATIKTHHNVGGLLEIMPFPVIEPLRDLFKDEVRQLGHQLSLPSSLINRHPFPGPGLAIRIMGAITRSDLDLLRQVDAIYLEELHEAGIYHEIAQAFAVLVGCRSVGVQGDRRTYEQVVALRAVTSTDFMTADVYEMDWKLLKRISTRIMNQVKGVNRVTFDTSTKPPSTIEWE